MRVGLVVVSVSLVGCGQLFGLDHVDDKTPGGKQDAAIDSKGDAAMNGDGQLCGAGAETPMTFSNAADTFVSNGNGHLGHNYGGLPFLFACYDCDCGADSECESVEGSSDDVLTLIRFDISAIIPCSEVVSATLSLTTDDDNIGDGSSLQIFAVLEAWDEGTGTELEGANEEANWTKPKAGVAWASAGVGAGSRSSTEITLGGFQFAPRVPNMEYGVPLDPAIVQTWVDDPAANRGMVFEVTGDHSDVHFYSSEAPSFQPRLTVVVKPPA